MHGQDRRRPGSLLEVEVGRDVPEHGCVLANVWPRIRPPVRGRIERLAAHEVALNEFEVGVEAQNVVIDVPSTGVRADDQSRDPKAVAQAVDTGKSTGSSSASTGDHKSDSKNDAMKSTAPGYADKSDVAGGVGKVTR